MIMLFVYAGVSKLIAQQTFLQQLKMDPYIGGYANWLSWTIPLRELMIATLLLFKKTRMAGCYAFTFLMVLFTIFITAILVGGKQLPCSCGGIIQQLNWQQHLIFNSCFIVLGIVSIILHRKISKR